MRAIRPRAGHRAERQQQHRRGPQRQQHQVRLVPEADIRGITPQQRLAAAGADALCKNRRFTKNAGDDANSSGVTRFSVVFSSVDAPMAQNIPASSR